jgi:hypothetical protein
MTLLLTLRVRLEDETRKREDAEHNLVLFRKVSPVHIEFHLPPPACISRVASVGEGRHPDADREGLARPFLGLSISFPFLDLSIPAP